MVRLEKEQTKNVSFYKMITESNVFFLDIPAVLYGTHFAMPTFKKSPKPLKFICNKKYQHQDTSAIFITNSEMGFGALFIDFEVDVFCTKPVYEQILLKYEGYRARVVYYDEEDTSYDHVVSIKEANIEQFKKNVKFVTFNQRCEFYQYIIVPLSAGTNIGWANYKIVFPNDDSLIYMTSYTMQRRFTVDSSTLNSTYLIINRPDVPDLDEINMLTDEIECLRNKERSTIVIPVDYTGYFIDVIFHVLSLVEMFNVPIYIKSEIFNKLVLLINIQSEWLNSDYNSTIKPFPIRNYNNLIIIDSFAHNFETRNKLIFVDSLEQIPPNLFKNCTILNINSCYRVDAATTDYLVKFESTTHQIKSVFVGKVVEPDEFVDGKLVLKSQTDYYKVRMSGLNNVIQDMVFIKGRFISTDQKDRNNIIHAIKNTHAPVVDLTGAIFINDWLVLPSKRKKYRITDRQLIEDDY